MEYFIFAGVLLLFIVLIMIKGYLDSRREQKRFEKRLSERYGEPIEREYRSGELEEHVSMYYRKHEEAHQLDDITWHDLNMNEAAVGLRTGAYGTAYPVLYGA